MTVIEHGGRLDQAISTVGGTRQEWTDLSTGINPFNYPIPDIGKAAWTALPDGSQMHIQLRPLLFAAQPVAVVGFTYQEHALCWQRAGHEILVSDGLESAEASARIIIVVNPNNPDGKTRKPERLLALARG